jgi:2-dehydro-3-deoxygalactonokinase
MKNLILCCDWGTSSFRLRLVDKRDCKVIACVQSKDGIAHIFEAWKGQQDLTRPEFYARELKNKICKISDDCNLKLSRVPLLVSGMASSSIGIVEMPYATLPFPIDGSQASLKIFEDIKGLKNPLILISGVKSDEDVMRGEETQLIGLLHLNEIAAAESNDGIFVFPGTHSKHIYVKDGSITDFQTFMTGEMFNVLTEHSILKDSVKPDPSLELSGINLSTFKKGVAFSGTSPLLHSLFTVRANQLFKKLTAEQNSFYLSGLLIGSEIRHLKNEDRRPVVVCSGKNLFEPYKIAFEELGFTSGISFIPPELIDKATIAGQLQIFSASNIFSYD